MYKEAMIFSNENRKKKRKGGRQYKLIGKVIILQITNKKEMM